MVHLSSLTCEHRSEPLGLDILQPRLGWQLDAERRGVRQTAYQIRVASSPEVLARGDGDLWDSGRIASDQSVDIAYAGMPLTSRQRAWWCVRVWDELGEMSESAPTWWEMGLLTREDWQATWIGAPLAGGPWTAVPCPYLRTTFAVAGPVAAARLYITALGLYDCTLNGQPVGEDVLTPGWTDYHTRVRYQAYDVTAQMQDGPNALGAILGDGWCCGQIGWRSRQTYQDRPRLLAQLEIQYADGRRQVVASDAAWQCAFGPLLSSDLLMGENYDARLEMPGWDTPDFDAARWQPVMTFADPGTALVASNAPMIRRMQTLAPIAEPTRAGGAWIFDLGQNMVGGIRLQMSGPAGTTVKVRYAEVLNPDGTLYTTNLRAARATDYYTLRGEGEETWASRFTFHGFRYVEISGLPDTPTRDTVAGIVLHSAVPCTGEFTCSDPLVTQLQHNIQWGQKGNFLDVPTDCPQRDERLGWTGDAQVFARTAMFNLDVSGFFTKWLQDLRDAQRPHGGIPCVVPSLGASIGEPGDDGGPAWSDAMVIIPWTHYLCYGDPRVLAEHYDSMVRFVNFLQETSKDCRRCDEDATSYRGFGDWLALDGSGRTDGGTPKALIGTAFFAHAARLLGRMAAVLGKTEDAARYEALFTQVRAAFQRRFVTPDGLIVGQTQTSYVLALHFDLLPAHLRPMAAAELVADIRRRGMHLATGFVGTPYLPHVLTQMGYLDVAYALLHQQRWPSWLYAVTQGATTIWERWDGWTHDRGFQDPGMNSFNHYAYGAIGEWLYNTVAGMEIDPARPGYKHVLLRPRPGGAVMAARGSLQTRYGQLVSDWRIEGASFIWEVTVPANTTATAYVPAQDARLVTEGAVPAEAAEGVAFLRMEEGAAVYALAAGRYRFTAPIAVAAETTAS